MLNLEWFVIDLTRKWKREGRVRGSRGPIARWAFNMFTLLDFTEIRELESLEIQVRALSRLAGLTYDDATCKIRQNFTSSAPPIGGRFGPLPREFCQEMSLPLQRPSSVRARGSSGSEVGAQGAGRECATPELGREI